MSLLATGVSDESLIPTVSSSTRHLLRFLCVKLKMLPSVCQEGTQGVKTVTTRGCVALVVDNKSERSKLVFDNPCVVVS